MTKATMVLRAGVIAAALLVAGAYNPAKAQLILEMSALTCKNIIEAPPERQILIAAWMSGYFNAERNMPTVDFGRFAANKNWSRSIAGATGKPTSCAPFGQRHSEIG